MARPKGSTKRKAINRKIGEGVSKMKEETLKKLDDAFAIDLNIKQACIYAGVVQQTYYNWIEKKPELLERFDKFKHNLSMKAKANIAKKIKEGDVPLSERYLARKEPEEYGDRLKIEHSGAILSGDTIPEEDKQAVAEFHEKLKDNMLKRSQEKAKEEGEL